MYNLFKKSLIYVLVSFSRPFFSLSLLFLFLKTEVKHSCKTCSYCLLFLWLLGINLFTVDHVFERLLEDDTISSRWLCFSTEPFFFVPRGTAVYIEAVSVVSLCYLRDPLFSFSFSCKLCFLFLKIMLCPRRS